MSQKVYLPFVKPMPISELPETTTLEPGNMFLETEDGKTKKIKTEVFSRTIISGIKGDATPSSSPTAWVPGNPDLYEKWDIKTAGTYTNFKDASTPTPQPIVVTPDDLKNNYVQIWVKNGVSQKMLSAKPIADITAEQVFDPTDDVNPSTMKAAADRYDRSRDVLTDFLSAILTQDASTGFTNGYLSRQNTVPVTNAENKSKLNIDVSNFNKLNFKGYPSVITSSLSVTYCCILGIKEDGTKVVIKESAIIPATPPFPQTSVDETFDISDYKFLSLSVGNLEASLNQVPVITLINDTTGTGLYKPNAVRLYIDEEIESVREDIKNLSSGVFGELNSIDSFAASNMRALNAGASINAGVIAINGSGSAVIKEYTLNENSEMSFIYKELTASNTMFGFDSLNTYGNAHHVYLRYNTSGTNNGKLQIIANKTLSYSQLSTTSNTNYTIGDFLKLSIKRKGLTYYFTVYNLTKGWSIKMQQTVTPLGTPFVGHNAASPAVINSVGNVEVYNYRHTGFSSDLDYAINGDSITYGQSATVEANRWASKINGNNIIMGGGADTTGLVLIRINEIIKLKPKKVLLMIGGNDILYSLPAATWQQNLKDIRTALFNAGIEVIHLFPTPRAGAGQLINFIKTESLFRTDLKIDTNTLLMNGNAETLAATFDSGDHLHPNEAGHTKIAEIINSIL